MEDDIYGDLENYNDVNALDELRKENQELKFKVEEYATTIARLQKDLDNVNLEFKTMEINFSSLLKTARAEIERKTQIINNLNLEKNIVRNRSLSKGKRESEGKKPSSELPETKKLDGERGRKDENRLPSLETLSSVTTEDLNKTGNIEHFQAKKPSFRTDEAKENVSDIKSRSQSIRNRRKSMPVANKPKFSSDEEDNANYSNGEIDKKEWYSKDDKHRKTIEKPYSKKFGYKISETSGIDEKCSSYHESSRETSYRDNFGRTNDRYRNPRDRKDLPQRQRRLLSPEYLNRRTPKEHFDERSRNSNYGRYRNSESPPIEKYTSYRRNRSRERRSNVEKERHGRSRSRHDRYSYKHKLHDFEEPSFKRVRTDSSSRPFDEYYEVTEIVEDTNIPKNLESLDNPSCQSPDFASSTSEPLPVKEIVDSATTHQEDPRLSSKRYIKQIENDKVVLSAVGGKNIHLVPIDSSEWHIQQGKLPEALMQPPGNAGHFVDELYGDLDPGCSASVESGEIQSDYTDDVVGDRSVFNDAVRKCRIDNNIHTEFKENHVQETVNATKLTQYIISEHRASDKDTDPFVKELDLDTGCSASVESGEVRSNYADNPDDMSNENGILNNEIRIPDNNNHAEMKDNHVEKIEPQESKTKLTRYKIPKRKTSAKVTERFVKDICADLDSGSSTSVEPGELQSECANNHPDNKASEKQVSDNAVQKLDNNTHKEAKQKHVEENVLEESATKETQKNIPKRKMCDNNNVPSTPNPLRKLLSEYNISPEPVNSVKKSGKLDVDKFFSPDKNSERSQPKVTKIENCEVLDKVKKSMREMVEGDLELSDDESNDNLDTILKRKSKSSDRSEARKSRESIKDHSVSQTINEKKKKPITLKIAKDKNTQYHCIEQKKDESIPETSAKRKTKKKKRNSQEVKTPTEPNAEANKTSLKSKTDEKPKETKAKFNDLFGETSSLITPEDLGAITRHDDCQSSSKYLPMFEDAQDAIDMSLTPIKPGVVSISNEPEETIKSVEEPINGKEKNDCMDVAEKSNLFINLNSGPLVPEVDVVSTIIISTGVQPNITCEELNNQPMNQCTPSTKGDSVHKDIVNTLSLSIESHINTAEEPNSRPLINNVDHKIDDHTETVLKNLIAPVALATSTPHKSICQAELSRVPESNSNSSDCKLVRNEDSAPISCQSNSLETEDQGDAPDIRIFVKRRRKVLKKAVSK